MARDIESEEMCKTFVRWCGIEKRMVQRGYYLIWNVWSERNKKLFENHSTPTVIMCQRIGRHVEEFNLYATRIYGNVMKAPVRSSPR